RGRGDNGKFIPSIGFEKYLIDALRNYLDLYRAVGVDAPVFLTTTLLGVRGYTMGVPGFPDWRQRRIDRQELLVPEAVIEDLHTDADRILRPALDAVWNACGFEGSPNFDKSGRWTHPRS